MEPTKLEAVRVSSLRDPDGRLPGISSAPAYDEAMASVFPYFMYVSFEEAEELGNIISQGMRGMHGLYGYGSYASTMDFRSDGKVLWMSDSSYATLKVWVDPAKYTLTSIGFDKLWNTPRPQHVVPVS